MAAWTENKRHGRPRDRLPPRPRADAGLHRRARRGRSGRHARRHEDAGRRLRTRSIRWSPVDLVIDHSVMVDKFGTPRPSSRTSSIEYERNNERYDFLRWGPQAFDNFRVVPPGTGICHQVNLEYLAQTVWTRRSDADGKTTVAFPDTVVGTDSHTTMINGLAVLGWGVGGIEAEAAMLGQPISDADPGSRRLQADRQAARRRHRHRPGADRHPDAAQEGRGRQVRRILRPRPGRADPGRPRHHRQHGAGIWRDLRLLPGRSTRRCAICARPAATSARVALVEDYAKAQGLWSTPTSRPIRSSPTRWNWTWARSSRRWPARSARRTASR